MFESYFQGFGAINLDRIIINNITHTPSMYTDGSIPTPGACPIEGASSDNKCIDTLPDITYDYDMLHSIGLTAVNVSGLHHHHVYPDNVVVISGDLVHDEVKSYCFTIPSSSSGTYSLSHSYREYYPMTDIYRKGESSAKSVNLSLQTRIVLTWIDPPGNPSLFFALKNDLDLSVNGDDILHVGNEHTHRPLYSGSLNITMTETPHYDRVNNVEKITLLPRGDTQYTVMVHAKHLVTDRQSFALVMTLPHDATFDGQCECMY